MSPKSDPGQKPTEATTLRKQAEEQARTMEPISLSAQPPEAIGRMLHELQVHQIELEMQNEELRRAQAEIEDGRARYFDLYDLAPVGYCTLSEKGLILEANLTAATLLGVARSALVKHPISRFILKEDQNLYYQHRKQLFETGESQECDLRLVKADGTSFWAHLTGSATHGQDGEPVCRVVISDITERKQAEKELRQSESLFRTLVNAIPDLIWLKDADGVYLACNKRFERFFGASEAEIRGKTDYDFVDEELADLFREYDRKALAIGGPSRNEEQITDADDGHTIFLETIKTPMFDSDGNLVGVLGIGRDITERKQAEEALKDANVVLAQKDALLRSMLLNLPFDFWARDLHQNMLIQSIESIRLWGDLTGTAFHEANLAPEYLEVWKATNACVLTGEVVASEQAYVVCGEQRKFHAIVAPSFRPRRSREYLA